jgi:phage-related tail fiber protein
MANITEISQWVDSVYEIATDDPVQGGTGGINNRAAEALANRTRYLYDRAVATGITGQAREINADLNTIQEPGFYAVVAASANNPGSERGHMIVSGRANSVDGGPTPVVLQIFFARTGESYFRQLSAGAWGSWIEIATSLSLARLNPMPPGSVMAFAGAVAPTGFFLCRGQLVSRTEYADLFAVIADTYGAGDGSTTFQLPDLRGEFVRGFDAGRGVDAGRALGSFQQDQFAEHFHTFDNLRPEGPPKFGDVDSTDDGAIDEPFPNVTESLNSGPAGAGTETRPRNIAMNYIIRY